MNKKEKPILHQNKPHQRNTFKQKIRRRMEHFMILIQLI